MVFTVLKLNPAPSWTMIISSQNCPFVVVLQWNENGDTPMLFISWFLLAMATQKKIYKCIIPRKKIWIVEVVFLLDMNDLNFRIDRSATENVVQFWSLSLCHATPWERVQGQLLFAHVSMRSSFSYFSSCLPLRMSVSRKPQCFNMGVDSHLLVNESIEKCFLNNYDRGFIDALTHSLLEILPKNAFWS